MYAIKILLAYYCGWWLICILLLVKYRKASTLEVGLIAFFIVLVSPILLTTIPLWLTWVVCAVIEGSSYDEPSRWKDVSYTAR